MIVKVEYCSTIRAISSMLAPLCPLNNLHFHAITPHSRSVTQPQRWWPGSGYGGGLAGLQHPALPSCIDELIAALLPVCLCPGRKRPGYERESQQWHPPWCRYCRPPAGGIGGWQPGESCPDPHTAVTPLETLCEGKQGGVCVCLCMG